MRKIYKIHPGIGIARVGKSNAGYFIAGEAPGTTPFEIDGLGEVAPFTGYKDAASLMRRQGVRFRIFEYDQDEATGTETLGQEVTAAEAVIAWTVRIGATKAAQFTQGPATVDGARTIVPSTVPRNPEPPASLQTEITLTATGAKFKPVPGSETQGEIRGKPIYLGEVHTDAGGRLIVLPGFGDAFSWPDTSGQTRKMEDFYDNPGWYDDIADGSVDATVKIGSANPEPAIGAWVITAPPDFAPDTTPATTLYDIAQQAMNLPLPNPLTYPQDIEPIIQRAAGLFHTNKRPVWKTMQGFLGNPDLSDNSSAPAKAQLRAKVKEALLEKTKEQMQDYRLTDRQKKILELYANGSFQTSADTSRPKPTVVDDLDRSALERCVGGGFFPGIEGGTTLRQPGIFTDLARLTRGTFTDHDGSSKQLKPGLLSGRMACPWHADFIECQGNWWPSQRPDIVGRQPNGDAKDDWDRRLVVGTRGTHESHLNMVQKFSQLGVVVANGDGSFSEVGRDTALDTGV
jgi:L-Lysine epsilon oxidase N-terminal/L-lysine epsilon oxidase C-terminal domain